ncbi:hypothetical protein LPW11_04405 [Geomonas sp. RF6]|uniref:hypothetical protein n=1 Tax=Geomonas sp. RF6 TaxID=2897342 RepID=UPI001E36E885|nr:hypothetical protein [Geomonas sp. RF6]UFS71441.1 hypothetical protein LPW11_04405 [Geomonas sp. RF6]
MEERFDRANVPKDVADALAKGDEPLALKLAIQGGSRDVNDLTNMIFFTRHTELAVAPLDPKGKDFRKLSQEWSTIQDQVVWPAVEASAANTDLVVSGSEVVDHHRRFFMGKSGKRLKKLVEDAAREVDLNPGLLGTVMMAETRRPLSYLSSDKVSSYHIGADDFYEGRAAIQARVPAYKKVKWDKNQKPAEHLNDAQTNRRTVKTILFNSGADAVLATAVYLKFREVRLRELAKEAGGDFDTLPLATRIALTRIAMAAGTGGATPYLKDALKGVDIFDRRAIPVRAYQTKRNATVRTAQAMHLSDWVFGITVPPAVQPELEEYVGEEPETGVWSSFEEEEYVYPQEESASEEGEEWEAEESYRGGEPVRGAGGKGRCADVAGEEEAPDFEETEEYVEFEGVKPPVGVKLTEHYHIPKSATGTAGSVTVMDQQGMNPGFVSTLTDDILVDRRTNGLQTNLDNLIRTKYARFLATRSSAQESARAGDRLRVTLIDLTGGKLFKPDPAGWGSTFATDGASTPKICALYAAHQLRRDLNRLAELNSYTKKDDLVKGANAVWKKAGFTTLPRVAELFKFDEAADRSRPVSVAFSTALERNITAAYKDNSNCAVDQIISQVGFSYIASVMWQSGLRHQTRGGLWLWGGYCCTNKDFVRRLLTPDLSSLECVTGGRAGLSFRWKGNAMKEPKPVFPHNATALSVATYFALLRQGRLVDDASSASIVKTLQDACSFFWDGQFGGLVINPPPTKCGLTSSLTHDGILVKRTVGGKTITYAAAALTVGASDFPFRELLVDLDKLVRDKN